VCLPAGGLVVEQIGALHALALAAGDGLAAVAAPAIAEEELALSDALCFGGIARVAVSVSVAITVAITVPIAISVPISIAVPVSAVALPISIPISISISAVAVPISIPISIPVAIAVPRRLLVDDHRRALVGTDLHGIQPTPGNTQRDQTNQPSGAGEGW
jgi:hypothetical protein